MKFGVVTFPGSNCDQDMMHVLRDVFGQETEYLWHKDPDLKGCDFIILPGGFSYGDYLRSGAIARFSPIMKEITAFAAAGGFVMGICNGFQILCEAHLLPGALLHNITRRFHCRNVFIKAQTTNSLITSACNPDTPLKIPVAHGEGNYYTDETTLKELVDNDQVLFRYCDEEGHYSPEANHNGSLENIAGICNSGRNVFGMMPHPERAADPILSNTDGKVLFESILNSVNV